MSDQLASFNSRIKRINDPRNTYYVDPETGTFVPKRVSKQTIKKVAKRVEPPTFFGLIFAVLLGALALMGAQYLRWHYLEMDAAVADDTLLLIDFGIAAIAMFFVGGMIGQKSFRHMLAQTAGIGLMMVSVHNLVWLFPDEFSQVYSSAYVEEVQAQTTPQTIYLRGESFALPIAL